ncbi:MAG: hypothetical protein V1655_00955 [bacterium]
MTLQTLRLYKLYKLSSGFILIPTILITALLLTIGLYFLTFTISEKNISSSYSISQQAYYLAESGVEYAIWKLKNDPEWQTNFETEPTGTLSATGGSALFPNGQYDILVENYDLAKATVYATSTLSINDKTSQRVIKTQVFKAMGGSEIDNNAVFTGKNIEIWGSNIDINSGSIFANEDIIVTLGSDVDAQDKAQAVDNIFELLWSDLSATEIHAQNLNPPAPASIAMPGINFDFATMAQEQEPEHYYTNPEFRELLDDNPALVLDGVVYVTGNISIENGHNLTVNGVLATNGRIDIGYNRHWWESCPANSATLAIGHVDGNPSGIFANNITFNQCINSVNINGIVYASNNLEFNNRYCSNFTIIGSVIARDVLASMLVNGIAINFNEKAVIDTLGGSEFSPIITVEYWEEEY